MPGFVFLNNRFIPADKACISLYDRGFTYGDGLFETMCAYNGTVFALDLHLERLFESAKMIGIPLKQNKKKLTECIKKLLDLNNLTSTNAYIKLIVTRGVDFGGVMPSISLKPTVIIISKPVDVKIQQYQRDGLGAIFLSYNRSIPHIKSLNFLPSILGLIETNKNKMQEGIFTEGDKILEGTVSNIFVSDGSIIKTPPLKDGILAGVTRRIVIGLTKTMKIKIREVSITKNELIKSKEVFLTNSIIEIAPLIKIGDKLIGNGEVGLLTKKLLQSYKNMVSQKS